MKVTTYSFEALNPDLGDRGDSGAGFVVNMNPVSGIYVPGPAMVPIRRYMDEDEVDLLGIIAGAHTHDTFVITCLEDGAAIKVGDLYGVAQDPVEYDCTPASGWVDGIDPLWDVSFCSYGDKVFAATPGNKLVFLDMDDFRADPTSKFDFGTPSSGAYNPEARHIVTHGGHLVAAGITFSDPWNELDGTYGNMVWWSGFDNPESFGSYLFTPQILGSDYKFLYDTPGDITGMVSSGDHLFVFKENYIYLAEGPPFRFNLLAANVGTRYPSSILYHKGWVYFMSVGGPARISVSGDYEMLCEGKTKVTLNMDGVAANLHVDEGLGALSFNSAVMYPFAFNGFSVSRTYSHTRVWTAVSEQYNIIYFAYPAFFAFHTFDPELFTVSNMVLMSYDLVSENVGYTIPWGSDQEGTPTVPFQEIPGELPDPFLSGEGTRNFFVMKTLGYKPSKGKAKDVIIIGTSDPTSVNTSEDVHPLQYYYLDPTIFYGKNWSIYTKSSIATKIIRPEREKTKIRRIRPIMRFGYNSNKFQPVCQVATFSDTSISGIEIYGHEPFNELGPYSFNPLNLIDVDESSIISADGSILFENTVYGDEHIIVFGFHTEASGGPTAKADFVTTTGILGIEIFYDVQGIVSR